jgi:hypothetical protein
MKYSAKALIVYLIAMVILVVINETVSIELNTLHLSFCGLFMFGTSVAVHHFTVKASKERPQLFPTYFMAITGLKMMVYIVTLGVYVYIFKDSATPRHHHFPNPLCGLHSLRGDISAYLSK